MINFPLSPRWMRGILLPESPEPLKLLCSAYIGKFLACCLWFAVVVIVAKNQSRKVDSSSISDLLESMFLYKIWLLQAISKLRIQEADH
jgi:hypothetical protein